MSFGAVLYVLLGIASFFLVGFLAWAAFKDRDDE
jgi:hypothetical protein